MKFASSLRSCFRTGFVIGYALLAVVTASAGAQQMRPALTPQPREMRLDAPSPVHIASISVPGAALPGADAEDSFAASRLSDFLKSRGVAIGTAAGPADLTIELLRANSSAAEPIEAAAKLTFSAEMNDEGYLLVARKTAAGTRVSIIAATAAGVFYGTETLRQMMQFSGGAATLWAGSVRDWPAMKYRGIHDDLSRGPVPTIAFMKHQLDVFAAHKVNLYSPYFEHTLLYSGDPLAAPPGGAITRAQAQEIAAYARRLHITVVPEQEAFGHLHHVLVYEKYADLAESPHGP